MIVGLEGFSQMDSDGEWKGTLDRLATCGGYMLYSNSDKELVFAQVAGEESNVKNAPKMEATPWGVDIHQYPSVKPVTATISNATADYIVGAFCGDECRGIGVEVDGKMMIAVHGESGDMIHFRFLSASDDKEYRGVENIAFNENPLGTLRDPYELNFSTSTLVESTDGTPRYELTTENGNLVVKGDLSSLISIEVYDPEGHKLAESAKGNDGMMKISEIEPGVCLILIRTTEGDLYRKMMVK